MKDCCHGAIVLLDKHLSTKKNAAHSRVELGIDQIE
jgi:hypothetical protein